MPENRINEVDDEYSSSTFGFTEEITDDNFYEPTEADYVDFGEEEVEWDVAADRPGLWENIRRKKEREGKNYKPAKTEKEGRPTQEQLKRAQSEPTEKQKKALDKNKDGKISKEDFELLRKGKSEESAEALQKGKPGPNDPRKTPAPKKDRKKGSKKNKPDSAKDDKGKITFSAKTVERLKNKVADHNSKGKGSKATLGMLKAVYRRGAGAYSTSHAPKMSRDGWAMARVNAFLYLLKNGRPSNPNYKQDNDLLPSGHKRSSKAEQAEARLPRKKMYIYKNPKTSERKAFDRRGNYTDDGQRLVYVDTVYASEYQGRKVKLNKPFRTPDGPKKMSVYVKNEKGNVVKVNFGDPNMEIKKDNPARRKSFRARHNCDNPGPKWKARYWSCKAW
jgi:hypothetical protein